MAHLSTDVKKQADKANQGQTRDVGFKGKKHRGGYASGSRVPIFDQQSGVTAPVKSQAFSGKGFLPNLFASHAPVTMCEASATRLENEGVHGREGMLPPPGILSRLQPGGKLDEGAGGAGSFLTVPAYKGKVNG